MSKPIQILDGISGLVARNNKGMWRYSLITDKCVSYRSDYAFSTRANALTAMDDAAERLADTPSYARPSHG